VPAAPPILGSTGSTTLVLAVVLVALGIGMILTTVWIVRATRTDTPVLGPLEVLGDRRFARRDPDARAAALTAARPPGFHPPAPMVDLDPEVPPPADAAPMSANGESSGQEPAPTAHSSVPGEHADDEDDAVDEVETLEPAPEAT
jgi:hypothetical protein